MQQNVIRNHPFTEEGRVREKYVPNGLISNGFPHRVGGAKTSKSFLTEKWTTATAPGHAS